MDNSEKVSLSEYKVKFTDSNGHTYNSTPTQPKDDGKIWPQVYAILTACLVALTCGILFSWTSPFMPKITKDHNDYNISEEEASYFTVITTITMSVTSLLFSRLNDIIGRKPSILMIAVPHLIAWILAAIANNVWVFYASRFFAGIGGGCMFSSVPMYIGEISTPKVRGVWGNALTFATFFGQLSINVIGSYCDVKLTSYICMSIPVTFLVLFSFAPESPYFYVMKGRFKEAKDSLRRLTRKENVEDDFVKLKSDVERQMSEPGTWTDLFTIESNRRALYAGIFLRCSQQMSGSSSFAVYAQYLFQKSGGELSPEVSSIIYFSAICFMNLVGAYTLDLFGRRISYIISLSFCSIILFMEAVYFYIDQYETAINITFLNWIPITGMILYVVFFSIGLGIVPTLMLGELFSASIKSKGLAVLILVFGILVSTITKLFHVLTTNFGLYAPFLFFSVNCCLSIVLSLYLIPETKGKTLEEIQQSMKGPRKTPTKSDTENSDQTFIKTSQIKTNLVYATQR